MSYAALIGALETGLLMGIIALAVYISFRVLDFPDLTVDGSFTFGAAICATLITHGWNSIVATLIAISGGILAGCVTAVLNVRFKIIHLVASMLTMVALYSINIRVMGGPNLSLLGQKTIFSYFEGYGIRNIYLVPLIFFVLVALIKILLDRFMQTDIGLAMRATGENERMSRANGIPTGAMVILGIALSNALAAFAGALACQVQGAADVSMGTGMLILGLAAVIGGGAIFPSRKIAWVTFACVFGAVLYQLSIAFAIQASFLGLQASDVSFITAALVCLALLLPRLKRKQRQRPGKLPAAQAEVRL
jgi:putative ABC transport system permease protein